MKVGVLLSGCGVYDGAEIQEAIFTLLALEEEGYEALCIGVNKNQHHTINHLTGEEMLEPRNMLVEAARIARGNILDIQKVSPSDIDALIIPGGFGSAKNFTTWAFDGANGSILPEVKLLLVNMYNVGKPLVALCVSPVVLAKAFEGSGVELNMTLGSTEAESPYSINSFHEGVQQVGMKTEERMLGEVLIDEKNKIITAPCYMMEATVLEVRNNIKQAVNALKQLLNS